MLPSEWPRKAANLANCTRTDTFNALAFLTLEIVQLPSEGAMALELVISAAVGAILGLRYNVLVLVPAIAFAILFAMIAGFLRGDGFWSIALMAVLLGMAVQLGYLVGIAIYTFVHSVCTAWGRGRHQLSSSMRSARTWQTPC